jgi:RND family efflux transporter MFP subunit
VPWWSGGRCCSASTGPLSRPRPCVSRPSTRRPGATRAAAIEALAFQQRSTERDLALLAGGAISREDLERSELALARADATVSAAGERVRAVNQALVAARDRHSKRELVAPWDGSVVAVHPSRGDLARAGVPAVRLVQQGPHRVVTRLAQGEAREVRAGTPAILEARSERLSTEVSRVAAGLDPAGLVAVELDVGGPPFGLPDGASVDVTFELASGEGLVVPRAALLEGPEGSWVFTVREGRARAVPVEVVERGGSLLLVGGELEAGEAVVTEHPSILMTLAGGVAVRVLDAASEEAP